MKEGDYHINHLLMLKGREFMMPEADENKLTGFLLSMIMYPFRPRLLSISA